MYKRKGRGDGRENVYCGTYVREEGGAGMGRAWNIREPHIINNAALTVIGDRAAQHNVT
jgi:hypothetical protein